MLLILKNREGIEAQQPMSDSLCCQQDACSYWMVRAVFPACCSKRARTGAAAAEGSDHEEEEEEGGASTPLRRRHRRQLARGGSGSGSELEESQEEGASGEEEDSEDDSALGEPAGLAVCTMSSVASSGLVSSLWQCSQGLPGGSPPQTCMHCCLPHTLSATSLAGSPGGKVGNGR